MRRVPMKKFSLFKIGVLIFLLIAVVLFQFGYDATKPTGAAPISAGLSPDFIRAVDMGFHAGVGLFLWAGTMPEILDLIIHGKTEYLPDERYVNAIDPKLSYPYAFTVIVLPTAENYVGRVTDALAIGEQGIYKRRSRLAHSVLHGDGLFSRIERR